MSDSSSSGSDDEYLMLDRGAEPVDREDVVRRKLLQNFYGAQAVASPPHRTQSFDTDDDDGDLENSVLPADINSKSFDAKAHTKEHVETSSIHSLLETEEKLALEVRTLDSTMQTLVYENYTRFIDATDAIKSIGVNVTANEEKLQDLCSRVRHIDKKSQSIEQAIGTIRDQVAEKIRIKRLLTRLDALLKLPQTLRQHIQQEKYRNATRTYLSTASILSKHSEGFESLKSIEVECQTILDDMKEDLTNKLVNWSGNPHGGTVSSSQATVTGVMESAGTLLLLETDDPDVTATRTMAACTRILDRILDSHLIEVQEAQFREIPNLPGSEKPVGSHLVPSDFLDGILQVATLFSMTFGSDHKDTLTDFVSDSFGSFMAHIRTVILDECLRQSQLEDGGSPEEVSMAMGHAIRSVRELASGLVLPEVGINVDYSSNLVDRAIQLQEHIVRRGIQKKLSDLRVQVGKSCLIPFANSVAELSASNELIESIRNVGNATLLDCMQLADDSIRSIFEASVVSADDDLPAAVSDASAMRRALEQGLADFSLWLSSSLEFMAGGEMAGDRWLVETSQTTETIMRSDSDFSMGSGVQRSSAVSDTEGDDELVVLEVVAEAARTLQAVDESIYILAVAETCRLGVLSVPESLDQSMVGHAGESKRKSHGLFPGSDSSRSLLGAQAPLVEAHFQSTYSRCLSMLATMFGSRVGLALCTELDTVACSAEAASLSGPREQVTRALIITKDACSLFAGVFDKATCAGPVPAWDDAQGQGFLNSPSHGARKSGLQLDIERMFKESVTIYPLDLSSFEASRDSLVYFLLKVAFRSLLELCRDLQFSGPGFRQLVLDVEFLKFILPHYLGSEYTEQGTVASAALFGLLADVVDVALDRCLDDEAADKLDDKVALSLKAFVEKLTSQPQDFPFVVQ